MSCKNYFNTVTKFNTVVQYRSCMALPLYFLRYMDDEQNLINIIVKNKLFSTIISVRCIFNCYFKCILYFTIIFIQLYVRLLFISNLKVIVMIIDSCLNLSKMNLV